MISEEIKEKLKKSSFELFAHELTSLKTWTTDFNSETRYRIIGKVNENFSNYHYFVTIKEVDETIGLTINNWTLKGIYFTQDWNTLHTPIIRGFDPNNNEFDLRPPYSLQREIYDIYVCNARFEDRVDRIVQGVKMFFEACKYLDIKRYLQINEGGEIFHLNNKPNIDLNKWCKRFIEIQKAKRDFTEEQLQTFYGLYAEALSLYYKYCGDKK